MYKFKTTQLKQISNKSKTNLPKPPSGREWTEEEKKIYYKNFSKDWTGWRNIAIKLITKVGIELNQHRNTSVNLHDIEDFLHKCYKNGMSPEEAVNSYEK